jgi:hypothetical protein
MSRDIPLILGQQGIECLGCLLDRIRVSSGLSNHNPTLQNSESQSELANILPQEYPAAEYPHRFQGLGCKYPAIGL